MRGRVVEGARLEIVWAAMSRRFESSRFRQEVKKTRKGIFYFIMTRDGYFLTYYSLPLPVKTAAKVFKRILISPAMLQ